MGMRDMQTDTCHGACGSGCGECAKGYYIDLGPRLATETNSDLTGVDGNSSLVRNRMP